MTTPHRRHWMREYMSNYRRNSEKREELRKAHRFDSFIWRLSKFLSPRYDILMWMHASTFLDFDDGSDEGTSQWPFNKEREESTGVEYDNKNTGHENNDDLVSYHMLNAFPIFLIFYKVCEPGGGDIFKTFDYCKFYSHGTPTKASLGVVGVLDKHELLRHLSKLTQKERITWRDMIKILTREKETKKWHEINLSYDIDTGYLWKSLEWASRNDPDWSSRQFHTFLHMWERGRRDLGKRIVNEWWDGDIKVRFVASPIFDAMQPVVMEARDRGSRP